MRKKWFRVTLRNKVLYKLWDYGLNWVSDIIQRTAGSAGSLNYCTPPEELAGETPDILEYLEFSFYNWCWYNDNSGIGKNKLGKYLGVSFRVGSLMSYWVLTANGTVVSRTTVSRVTNIKDQTDENKTSITKLDKEIQERLNDEAHIIVEEGKGESKYWSEHPFDCNPDFQDYFSHVVSNEEVTEADDEF